MQEYMEKILHQEVQLSPYEEIQKLPLIYRSAYDLKKMTVSDQEALLAAPVEKIPLATLRKQQHQMSLHTGLPCVLYLKNMNYYTRNALLNEGIPFVWEDHQIYLPFMGTLLDENKRRALPSCMQISFLTQKLLLTALYQGWQDISVTKAAAILDVSKMSVTRCFDELEALDLPCLKIRRRARRFFADRDKKAMWECIRPILSDPVIKSYALKDKPDIALPMAGTMALAHYSLLDEGEFPIFAITKKDLAAVDVSADKRSPAGEMPQCVIQELGYRIVFEDGAAVDPLTVVLSINETELSDPRISMAVSEMLEEHVW